MHFLLLPSWLLLASHTQTPTTVTPSAEPTTTPTTATPTTETPTEAPSETPSAAPSSVPSQMPSFSLSHTLAVRNRSVQIVILVIVLNQKWLLVTKIKIEERMDFNLISWIKCKCAVSYLRTFCIVMFSFVYF